MKTKVIFSMVLLLSALSFMSCSKDEDESAQYTFTNTTSFTDVVYLFEYDSSGDKINSQTIEPVIQDKKYTFTADENAVKVKVYYKYSILSSTYSRWIQQVFVLKPGKTIDIVLEGETIVGSKEP